MGGGTETAPDLEFTGERIVPGKTAEALFREHEERYVFAGQYVSGKDVLDVACGTGVGASFLRSAGARKVLGLDIDPDAIAFASSKYADCEFAQSDATDLCLPDNSVDVVASFETLEHLKDQRRFLMECRRVLRPGGLLICSTPNLRISRWGESNPFHVREMHRLEFQDLVGSIFATVHLFSQRNRAYLPYIGRITAAKLLEGLGLRRALRGVLRREPAKEIFRVAFANSAAAFDENIIPYRSSRFVQPTFLIAVARKSP